MKEWEWELFYDLQKKSKQSELRKDIIIIILVIMLALEPILLFLYNSQYETVEVQTETVEENSQIDINNDGGGNIDYVGGNQYNGRGE